MKPSRLRRVQMCLPQAKVVVDKFHLIRHISRALDKMRTRLQGGNRRGKAKRAILPLS